MTESGTPTIKAFAQTLPEEPGVYRMLDAAGQVLYVGKAKRLKRRVLSYTRPQDSARIAGMVSKTASMVALTTRTENEALLLEQQLVRELNPPFNIRLKDSKPFPGILITTKDTFPRISAHRGRPPKGARFFGPFAQVKSVDHTVRQIQRLFLLRSCDDAVFSGRTRPCLLHQIQRCSAPCVGRVSQDQYNTQVQQATAFLEGRRSDITRQVEAGMVEAAAEQRYEDAARLRDRLKALTQIQEDQHITAKGLENADIVAAAGEGDVCIQVLFIRGGQMRGSSEHFPSGNEESLEAVMAAFLEQFYTTSQPPPIILVSHMPAESDWIAGALTEQWKTPLSFQRPTRGEKHKLLIGALRNAEESLARRQVTHKAWSNNLAALSERLALAPIRRVEVYDNSHIQGVFALGVAVVAGPEGFIKSHYRRYNFPKDSGIAGNDTAMMAQMLTRRFSKMRQDPDAEWPDLLLIDGGRTQLRAALDALSVLGLELPCVGVSKGEDRDAGKELLHFPDGRVVALPMKDPVLYFIQRLRDEAHRFAISSHRQARTRATTAGALDGIPGLGPAKKRALIARFGSQKAAKAASIDELLAVRGISADLAQRIKDV